MFLQSDYLFLAEAPTEMRWRMFQSELGLHESVSLPIAPPTSLHKHPNQKQTRSIKKFLEKCKRNYLKLSRNFPPQRNDLPEDWYSRCSQAKQWRHTNTFFLKTIFSVSVSHCVLFTISVWHTLMASLCESCAMASLVIVLCVYCHYDCD